MGLGRILRAGAVLVSGATLAQPAQAADSWICIPKASNGFKYDPASKTWKSVDFMIQDRYLIRQMKDEEYVTTLEEAENDPIPYGVFTVGENDWSYICKRPFVDGNPNLHCDAMGDFIFNRKTLRFIMTYTIAYFTGTDETDPERHQTPLLQIGSCSPL